MRDPLTPLSPSPLKIPMGMCLMAFASSPFCGPWKKPDNGAAAAKKEIANLLCKHGGKTREELKTLMPRLEYSKDRWPFGFSFNARDGMTYVVEVTQDFKQWGELETIEGTMKQVKFIDSRQPLVPFKRNFYRIKVVD